MVPNLFQLLALKYVAPDHQNVFGWCHCDIVLTDHRKYPCLVLRYCRGKWHKPVGLRLLLSGVVVPIWGQGLAETIISDMGSYPTKADELCPDLLDSFKTSPMVIDSNVIYTIFLRGVKMRFG